jgi:predicted  nucleic acid-binding Zn-ribbon protein
MPHQCTNCGYVFADGSKEMLSGCPECSGATFQFHPDDTEIPEDPPDESPPDPEGGRVGHHVGRATSTVREWMSSGSSTTADGTDPTIDVSDGSDEMSDDETLSDDPGTSDLGTSDTPDAMDETDMNEADVLESDVPASEDTAQASARSEFVSPDKLPSPSSSSSSSSSSSASSSETQTSSSLTTPPSDGRVVREPTGDQPDLAELREELNDQFESIKIIEPGEYELNLMRLYNREEYIIALQENGRYIIQMPETWMGSDDE